MLMNNTKVVVINQMWYQIIRNDESNNFLINIYTSFYAILIKLAQKSAFLIKIEYWTNGHVVTIATKIKKVICFF